MESISELKTQWAEVVKNWQQALEESKKDENLRVEARKWAQRGLGLAIRIRKIYQDMDNVEPGKYEKEIKMFEGHEARWQTELEKLGSSMSGIPNTTFDDVAGLEDVKTAVRNYLFALKNPEIAKKYRIDTKIGLLLYGPPGTGKTLIAEAIAHELGVRYFVITPSHIFGSYVGESERNVREIFAELRACEDGAVLLVDECESIFSKRTGDSNKAAIGVANQLLQEMNGAKDSETERRVILGATNRPQMIDEAYLRYKRFSLHFYIGMPNAEAREKVIRGKLGKLPHELIVIDEMLRVLDEHYTCADISNIIEQCANRAMQEHRERVERGENITEVKINLNHFNDVMRTFNPSVKREDLIQYEEFRDRKPE